MDITSDSTSAWMVVAIIFIILFVLMAGLNIHMHLARQRTIDEIRAINALYVRRHQEESTANRKAAWARGTDSYI